MRPFLYALVLVGSALAVGLGVPVDGGHAEPLPYRAVAPGVSADSGRDAGIVDFELVSSTCHLGVDVCISRVDERQPGLRVLGVAHYRNRDAAFASVSFFAFWEYGACLGSGASGRSVAPGEGQVTLLYHAFLGPVGLGGVCDNQRVDDRLLKFRVCLRPGDFSARFEVCRDFPHEQTVSFTRGQDIVGPPSGRLTMVAEESYDFGTGSWNPPNGGHFYFSVPAVQGLGGEPRFWANNTGQSGVRDLGDVGEASLGSLLLPSSGYTRFGVAVVPGHTYVALPAAGDDSPFVVFRVVGLGYDWVTLDFQQR